MFRRKQPFGLGLDLRRAGSRPSAHGRRPPLAGWEALTPHRPRSAAGLVSAGIHAAVLLLWLFAPRLGRKDAARGVSQPARPQVVYLMPKEVISPPKLQHPVRPPRPRSLPRTPVFAEAVARRRPELHSPAEAKAPETPDHDQPAAMTPKPLKAPGEVGQPRGSSSPESGRKEAAVEWEDAMVSEARRLFGPPAPSGGTIAGPVRAGLPVRLVGGGTRCPFSGVEVAATDGPSDGVIEGVVRTESSGHPIPGAFLQLLGSGSATFADAVGRYRLTFDPALVDVCRSQLVRVTAPGFRARTMVLAYGARSNNIVDLAARH